MSTKRAVERRAAALGVTLTFDGGEFCIEAPPGRIFVASETHYGDFGVDGFIYDTRRDAYEAALSDMSQGTAECGCDECVDLAQGG